MGAMSFSIVVESGLSLSLLFHDTSGRHSHHSTTVAKTCHLLAGMKKNNNNNKLCGFPDEL